MFNRFLVWLLSRFLPMSGGEAVYIYYALAAAGTYVTVQDQVYANKMRQMQLEEELRSKELAAIEEETLRLRALQDANEDILLRAGGIDAWASPSLIAARNFNFKMGMEDIENIRMNLQQSRSSVAARISVLKANTRATRLAGIFEVAGIAAGAYDTYSQLGKTNTTATVLSKDGYPMSPVPQKKKTLTVLGDPRG